MTAAPTETVAPPIPGIVLRAFDPDRDYAALVDVMQDANLVDGVEWLPTVAQLRADHEHLLEFDPRRDIRVAEVAGRIVAAAETDVRTRDGIGSHQMAGWVRPAWRRRGLGRALLAWTEARAAEVARVDGRPPRRVFSAWPDEEQAGAVALYEGAGYRIVRYGFLMVRDLAEPIDERPLPAGLEVRPVTPDQHRAIWDADTRAFEDGWQPAERNEGDFLAWFAAPDLDTSLWQVAWDGDQVAGSVMTGVFAEENARLGIERGWLDHVSVGRSWRRRGLATALIGRSLRVLADRGLTQAALGVDAENPTGALSVYERLGFRRHRTGLTYQKELNVVNATAFVNG